MSGTVNPGRSKAKYAARGVHLDQDAAGRLLEGMGDHARREMIVRSIFWWSDKTRLIDRLLAPGTASRESSLEVVQFLRATRSRVNRSVRKMARAVLRSRRRVFAIAAGTLGDPCCHERADIPISSSGPWSFSHSSRNESVSDLATCARFRASLIRLSRREIVSNFTHEILTLDATDDRTDLHGRGRHVRGDNSRESSDRHSPLSFRSSCPESLVAAGIRIETRRQVSATPLRSMAATDLHNLLAPFPSRLARNDLARFDQPSQVVRPEFRRRRRRGEYSP